MIRPASPQELKEWDRIVSSFPNSRVFHLKAWVESIEGFTSAKGVYFVYEKRGRIVACFPGLVSSFGPIRMFCSPREGWQSGSMGPAFDPRFISTEEIFSLLLPFLRRNLRIPYVELACRGLDSDAMRRMGFKAQPLPTYVARLPPFNPDEALRKLDKKTRNQLRKATKVGLRARVGLTPGFADQYFEQITLVFRRRGFALPFQRKRVVQLIEHLGKTEVLVPVSVYLPDSETCIATGIFFIANQELFLWGWAHKYEYGSHCPVELLTWTAMEKAVGLGCTSFDLFGKGKAKEKYGAILGQGIVRWVHSSMPGLLSGREAARRLYRAWQRFRGGLTKPGDGR
jgi:hypothetical protein